LFDKSGSQLAGYASRIPRKTGLAMLSCMTLQSLRRLPIAFSSQMIISSESESEYSDISVSVLFGWVVRGVVMVIVVLGLGGAGRLLFIGGASALISSLSSRVLLLFLLLPGGTYWD
jgi:hypothetical protein